MVKKFFCLENKKNLNITQIANLGATKDQYDTIDLSGNNIVKLENFPILPGLKTLIVANNKIAKIGADLADNLPNLTSIVLSGNSISKFADLEPIFRLEHLERLAILDNPVVALEDFYYKVIYNKPCLRYMNFAKVSANDVKAANQLFNMAH
ncbi:bifunctional U2 small nuclear ribonucleoprotein A'/Leucine-rich repeat/Leucine-rich repeat domain superfamily [Babesia duncani]|uniref:Bifunctional U2 small nuclear ribonucleoprotein A'/Leucine-rich repeat/Leucine-rich repeat domain superfamily n=1 Tax=Babesia duncani TaxID=323732 RepID=A0AAD9ULZ7_9APIC|nr:bifunctional U2 small nuclear ribonucleoprotein A'/Leucine-rich repeat/Leucine-rich repeat domain superfamily [Babesia duncani]KAK2197399.1 bifunctional U2 small nuclear ribonucleoprotein A'/Leucine-rich repeat/Leucine-rich repeat domain superfamily [Babesia duncani]